MNAVIISSECPTSWVRSYTKGLSNYRRHAYAKFTDSGQSSDLEGEAADRHDFAIQINHRDIVVEWSWLSRLPIRVMRSELTRIIKLCANAQKDELVILNIAPSVRREGGDINEVLSIQAKIVSTVLNVTAAFRQSPPEIRLSSRRDEFDVRIYLGATRPCDLSYMDER